MRFKRKGLAKYFSRASTNNRKKFKFQAESVKRANDMDKKQKHINKPREIILKFSYSRGLSALKPRAANIRFEKNSMKNKNIL